jgi:two-component system, chemotaxis family, response regulator PixG
MSQDELRIAGSLLPYIYEEVVVLRDPQAPFNKLPRVPEKLPEALQKLNNVPVAKPEANNKIPVSIIDDDGSNDAKIDETSYTIACVDDSPTVLVQIGRILSASNLKFVAISDSLKAPMQILKLKPDLILLDVNMPKVDGYKLCSLLRNNPALKGIPIVMVTGNSGIIDRAKAKMAGSTDFLSKPFTEEGLLKMVFRHLS